MRMNTVNITKIQQPQQKEMNIFQNRDKYMYLQYFNK